MHSTPNIRDRHALRWVLGVGLVFVVVVVMGLQAARQRADERWSSVVEHWTEEWARRNTLELWVDADFPSGLDFTKTEPTEYFGAGSRGGNIVRGWRQARHEGIFFTLVLRQERRFFGSNLKARMGAGKIFTSAGAAHVHPALIETLRVIFSGVDVKLVVEP